VPRPFIFADVDDGGDILPITRITMQATLNGSTVTFLNGQTLLTFTGTHDGIPARLAGQFDARSYSTNVYPLTVTVRVTYSDGATVVKAVSTQLMIVNEATSQIAKGWTVAGLQRLYSTIGSGYMITNGDGSAIRFAGLGVRAADFSVVLFDSPSSTYTRTYTNGSRAVFNSVGQQISFIEPNGLTSTFGYDPQGRIQSIRDPFRKQPNGSASLIGLYYGANGLGGIQEPGADGTEWQGRTTGFTVDANRCLVSAEDPDNVLTRFTCDSDGKLSTVTDRKNAVTTFVYNAFTWKLSQAILPNIPVDAGGGATTNTSPVINYSPWQAQGLPTSITSSSSPWEAPPSSVVQGSMTDAAGRFTSFKPNRFGQAIDITNPFGVHTTLTMSGILPTVITHPNGSTDRYRYDAFGRMIMSRPAGKDSTNFTYSGALGQLSDVWGPAARTEHRDYDAQNRVSKISYDVDQTQWVMFFYDPSTQRPFQIADNNAHGTNFLFDPVFGNVKQVTDQAGRVTTTSYDSYGRVATVSAAGHATQTTGYDLLNRVISRSDGVNPATTITYDALVQTDLQDGNGNVYHTDHNALGWVTGQCEGSSCITTRYNRVGEPTSSTNRRGQMVNLTRDALGRVTSKNGGGTVPATYSYSTNQKLMVMSNGIETDSLRLFPGSDTAAPSDTTVIWIKPDSTQAPRRYQIVHTGIRTLAGSVTTSITSNTAVTFMTRHYRIAANGLLDQINDGFNVTPMTYNTDGLRSSTGYGSSIGVRTEDYTTVHSPWSTTFANGTVDAGFHRSYHYDGLTRIDRMQSYPSTGVTETTYSYDQLGQLSGAVARTGCALSDDNASVGTTYNCSVVQSSDSYTYDAMGNRTDHGSVRTQWNRYQSFNGSTFAYDLDGNDTLKYNPSGHTRKYFWNAENQLDSAMLYDTGARTFYEYNASGKPVRIWDGDTNGKHVQRYLIWDGEQLLAEFNPDGTRITDYIYNPGIDQPFAHTVGATTPSGIRYHQQDALGNVIGTAENGVVSQSVTYDAWGVPAINGNADSRLLWKGLIWEGGVTSLYYVRSRWYDPEAGRFMSEDPVGHAGGLNLYAFGGNDPVGASDPSGTMQYDRHGAVCSINGQCGDPLEFPGGISSTAASAFGSLGGVSFAGGVIEVKKGVNWNGVTALLRAAVEFAASNMDGTLFISAGKEVGDPHSTRSFHAMGWAVDISRINGVGFKDMTFRVANVVGLYLAAQILYSIPRSHWAEVFGPGFAYRFDKELSDEVLAGLSVAHRDHVHISINP
jgi:RHS repeat-associated protein